MDPAAIAGLVIAFGAIMASNVLEGGNPIHLFAPAALILIFVGTFAATMASGTLPGTIGAIKWLIYALTAKKVDLHAAIDPLVKMAEKARREGLLALETEIESVEDEFMKRALQLAVDGTDPDDLFEILSAEVRAKKAAAAKGGAFWSDAGCLRPDHRHHRNLHGTDPRPGQPRPAGEARPHDRCRLPRHVLGHPVRERDVPALGQADQGLRGR